MLKVNIKIPKTNDKDTRFENLRKKGLYNRGFWILKIFWKQFFFTRPADDCLGIKMSSVK